MTEEKIFPFDFDDKELNEELRKQAKSLRSRGAESAQIDIPFIQLGIVELQSRITSKLNGIVETQNKASSNFARKSLLISGLSFTIAIAALCVSILLSISSSRFEEIKLRF